MPRRQARDDRGDVDERDLVVRCASRVADGQATVVHSDDAIAFNPTRCRCLRAAYDQYAVDIELEVAVNKVPIAGNDPHLIRAVGNGDFPRRAATGFLKMVESVVTNIEGIH